MNIIFGIASADNITAQYANMQKQIERRFQAEVQQLGLPSGSIQCGLISNRGIIVGRALHQDHLLVYIGHLQKPLPGWHEGSPLDNPDKTAHYLLTRYLEKGMQFLNQISGQFAVVICNLMKSELILASDPNGFRKIFYSQKGTSLAFSTHLMAMANGLNDGFTIDRSLENFLLGYEFLPWNRTYFKEIERIPPGTVLTFADGKIEKYAISHANPLVSDPETAAVRPSENEIIDSLYATFMNVLDKQCPSTDSVAVLLGGLDSALVASCLKQLGKKVETFSFYFEDLAFNQALTDKLATFLGINHTWVPVTPQIIGEGLQNYSSRFNQISSQPHYLIQTAHLCNEIRRKGYLHCFTGDGCDEIFLGYPSVYTRAKLFIRLPVFPSSIVKILQYIFHWYAIEKHFGHTYRLARNVITILGRRMPVRGHISSRIFDELTLSRLRTERPPLQEKDAETILKELAKGLDHLTPLRLAYHGKAAPGLNKNKHEGSSNYSGISIQSPFLHPLMVEAGTSLSENLLRPDNKTESSATGKYILMKMVEEKKLLPKEIIYQKKASPVAAPVDDWYMGPLKDFMLNAISDLPFEYNHQYVTDLLQPKLPEDLFRKHISIGHYAFNAISLLVTYASFTKPFSDTPQP